MIPVHIDGHNRQWIDGLILMVLTDITDRYFWLHIHRIHPSVKDFLFLIDSIVPDKRSLYLEVVVVRRIINLGTGNLEWGGMGKG
jgi:hypothetical protein